MYKILEEKSLEVSQVFDILSHPKRLMLLCALLDREKNITQLQEMLGISQSLVSQFALKMKDQGILISHKVGKEVFYRIADTRIQNLLEKVKNIYC